MINYTSLKIHKGAQEQVMFNGSKAMMVDVSDRGIFQDLSVEVLH